MMEADDGELPGLSTGGILSSRLKAGHGELVATANVVAARPFALSDLGAVGLEGSGTPAPDT